jgi:hypothetical protein
VTNVDILQFDVFVFGMDFFSTIILYFILNILVQNYFYYVSIPHVNEIS